MSSFDNGDMSSPKRHVFISLLFILKSQGKKCKRYKHVSSFEMNFSRNCTLHYSSCFYDIYSLDNVKMIRSLVRFVYILETL